jgi:hypothetical protein
MATILWIQILFFEQNIHVIMNVMINYYVSHVHVLGCYRQPQPMQHVDAERGVRAVMVVVVVVVVAATVKEKEEDN